MVAGDVQQKDVILAIVGGAIGLAGLLLVFQGFVLSAYASLNPNLLHAASVKQWYRRTLKAGCAVLTSAVVSVLSCVVWLTTKALFWVAVSSFLVASLALLVLAFVVTWKLSK